MAGIYEQINEDGEIIGEDVDKTTIEQAFREERYRLAQEIDTLKKNGGTDSQSKIEELNEKITILKQAVKSVRINAIEIFPSRMVESISKQVINQYQSNSGNKLKTVDELVNDHLQDKGSVTKEQMLDAYRREVRPLHQQFVLNKQYDYSDTNVSKQIEILDKKVMDTGLVRHDQTYTIKNEMREEYKKSNPLNKQSTTNKSETPSFLSKIATGVKNFVTRKEPKSESPPKTPVPPPKPESQQNSSVPQPNTVPQSKQTVDDLISKHKQNPGSVTKVEMEQAYREERAGLHQRFEMHDKLNNVRGKNQVRKDIKELNNKVMDGDKGLLKKDDTVSITKQVKEEYEKSNSVKQQPTTQNQSTINQQVNPNSGGNVPPTQTTTPISSPTRSETKSLSLGERFSNFINPKSSKTGSQSQKTLAQLVEEDPLLFDKETIKNAYRDERSDLQRQIQTLRKTQRPGSETEVQNLYKKQQELHDSVYNLRYSQDGNSVFTSDELSGIETEVNKKISIKPVTTPKTISSSGGSKGSSSSPTTTGTQSKKTVDDLIADHKNNKPVTRKEMEEAYRKERTELNERQQANYKNKVIDRSVGKQIDALNDKVEETGLLGGNDIAGITQSIKEGYIISNRVNKQQTPTPTNTSRTNTTGTPTNKGGSGNPPSTKSGSSTSKGSSGNPPSSTKSGPPSSGGGTGNPPSTKKGTPPPPTNSGNTSNNQPPPPPPPLTEQEEFKLYGPVAVAGLVDLKIRERTAFGQFNTSSKADHWKLNDYTGKKLDKQQVVNFLNDMKEKTYKEALTEINKGIKEDGKKIEFKKTTDEKTGKITFSFTNKDGSPVSKEIDAKIQEHYKAKIDINANQAILDIKADHKDYEGKGYNDTIKNVNGIKTEFKTVEKKKEEKKDDKQNEKDEKEEKEDNNQFQNN